MRFLINFRDKHPYKKATTIDYGIVMVMFPMVLLGSALGVQINVILPDAILLISLTLVLIFLSVESTIESIKIRRKENKILAEKNKKQAKEAISVEVLQGKSF